MAGTDDSASPPQGPTEKSRRTTDKTELLDENGSVSSYMEENSETTSLIPDKTAKQNMYTESRKLSRQRSVAAASFREKKEGNSSVFFRCIKNCSAQQFRATCIGTSVFTLYHVVFCLAMGSAITPPHKSSSFLGPVAKLNAIGTLVSGPILLAVLGNRCPAMYPCVDLFLAPFFAQMATVIGETMYDQAQRGGVSDQLLSDTAFLATFAVLSGVGMLFTVLLIFLAGRVKVANLGAFLPYAVICGFFSAVGVTLWTLSVSVDTGGKKVGDIVMSGDLHVIGRALLHHVPSLFIGIAMFVLGPKNPVLVPILAFLTTVVVYVVMLVFGVSLTEAQEAGWFWTETDLIYQSEDGYQLAADKWMWPAPFGPIACLFTGSVNFEAVYNGLPIAVAMALIYFLRSYLHAVALGKCVKNYYELQKKRKAADSEKTQKSSQNGSAMIPQGNDDDEDDCRIAPDATELLNWYATVFGATACAGGSAVTPSIPVGLSLFKLGADGVAPQYIGVFLLGYFYITDFRIVLYLPKMAFSALVVLSALEVMDAWFYKPYHKIHQKIEWSVVPLIAILTYVVGMLASVGLGLAISTLIFVAAFYRSGVVKFASNGVVVHSNVERTTTDSAKLDAKGNLIQILVIQNYMFFGNASSCLQHIQSMFREPSDGSEDYSLPPKPKYLVLDLTLITGMDASAVDVFKDIGALCQAKRCRLFISGASPNLRSILASGGLRQTGYSSRRVITYFPDLQSALGLAEDGILKDIFEVEEKARRQSLQRKRIRERDNVVGLRYALEQIDSQLRSSYADKLAGLEKYTTPVEIEAGGSLFTSHGGVVNDDDMGLFFVEYGLMSIEMEPIYQGSGEALRKRIDHVVDDRRTSMNAYCSIEQSNARSTTYGKAESMMKGFCTLVSKKARNYRVGRVGPGWILGSIYVLQEKRKPGMHVATTSCRFHHISRAKMKELEKSSPELMMELYRLLAHTMCQRHSNALSQFNTVQSIITSTPLAGPVNRAVGATNF